MKLKIPDLTATNVIDFSYDIQNKNFELEKRVIYDYASMSTFEPFGMLVMSSIIRNIVNNNPDCIHSDINFKEHTYAGTMGYFKSVYQDFGKKPGEALGSNKYIPMTKININTIRKESETEHMGETIERKSKQLAKVFSCGNNELEYLLTYMIREIMRNIVEHSSSSVIWFAGQHWPTKNLVEIAILDEGIGIAESLSKNLYYRKLISSEKQAIRLSMLPGVTKAFTKKKIESYDVWENSGYGLYVTSQLCNDLAGSFIILSGNASISLSNCKYEYKKAHFDGTAIRMEINTSNIENFEIKMKEIIKNGEKKAKTMKNLALEKASSASKSLNISNLLEEVFEDKIDN